MNYMMTSEPDDAAIELRASVGDIDRFELFNNQVLVAIYKRPEKTRGGIILTQNVRDEDLYQGKVGLVLKMGPTAFVDPEGTWFKDAAVKEGDWIVFRPSESWMLKLNGNECRILDDVAVRGKIDRPDRVF